MDLGYDQPACFAWKDLLLAREQVESTDRGTDDPFSSEGCHSQRKHPSR